jgi:[ribosomal protein S5]-alanine N-acetyltransferase
VRISIRPPRASDEASFLAAVRRSRSLHRPWVRPPDTRMAVRKFLSRPPSATHATFLIVQDRRDLVGVVNVSEIVRGAFRSAYLGYYAFQPHAGKGLMHAGMAKVIQHAFTSMKLHRLEANIQPGNTRSIGLAKALGFRREGFSPRYLKIGGRWRDHERWALVKKGSGRKA